VVEFNFENKTHFLISIKYISHTVKYCSVCVWTAYRLKIHISNQRCETLQWTAQSYVTWHRQERSIFLSFLETENWRALAVFMILFAILKTQSPSQLQWLLWRAFSISQTTVSVCATSVDGHFIRYTNTSATSQTLLLQVVQKTQPPIYNVFLLFEGEIVQIPLENKIWKFTVNFVKNLLSSIMKK